MPAAKKKASKKKEPAPIDPIRVEVGARLQAAREAVRPKLTQQDVADHFRINKSTVSAWEKGRGAPDVYVLRELTKLYGISGDAMLWEESAVPKKLSPEESELVEAYGRMDPDVRVQILGAVKAIGASKSGVVAQLADAGAEDKNKPSTANKSQEK